MNEDNQNRRPGETNITGLSALGAVVVFSLAGLVGCKSTPTRVAEFHDPFLPTLVAEAPPTGQPAAPQLATVQQAPTQQTTSPAKPSAKKDSQFQLTGY